MEGIDKEALDENKMDEDAYALMNRVEDKYFVEKKHMSKMMSELADRYVLGDIDTDTRLSRNRTIYLDSADLLFFHECIDKKLPRMKVRIRQYSPDDKGWEKVAYAEFKVKEEDGMTKKIRVRISSDFIDALSNGSKIEMSEDLININKDISRELLAARVKSINKNISKHDLKKKIEVQYVRRAFSGKNIRITIDEDLEFLDATDIKSATKKSIENDPAWAKFLKPYIYAAEEKPLILEVKTGKDHSSSWVRRMLKKVDAKQTSFSKYVACTVSHLKSGKEKGEVFMEVFDDIKKTANTTGEYRVMIEKKALRNRRLDELDEEEGMLATERMHTPKERGEMLDNPEVAFEEEEDPEIVNFQNKKDKKRDRLRDIMERHRLLKERQNAKPSEVEQVFEETIPDGGVTKAEEVAAETGEPIEELMEETNEEGELADRKQGVQSDEAFDKDLFLPIEELRILAPTFAEDYGYTGEETYIMPAGSKQRSELKALLSRVYERIARRGLESARVKNKQSFQDKVKADEAKEMADVDTLNDLEVRHIINYYKKIDTIEKRREPKPVILDDNEE